MFGIKKSIFIVLVLAFVVSGDIARNDTTNKLKDSVAQLTGELDSMNLSPGIQQLMGLPALNEGEDMLHEKCLKNGHNESFNQAMAAREEFQNCVSGLVDTKKLQSEISAAKPTGDLDTVFKKYCRKTPIVRGCIEDLLKGIDSCFPDSEKSQFTVLQNVTDSLMNFVCYKEGDRIALFIAEGGPECLTAKMDSVQRCINSTVQSAQVGTEGKNISTEDIPDIVFDSEKCGYFTQAQKCVVQVLEECSEPTPANIVGSLFDFVRKSTPCMQYYKTTGGSSSLVFSLMSILLPIGAIVLSKF